MFNKNLLKSQKLFYMFWLFSLTWRKRNYFTVSTFLVLQHLKHNRRWGFAIKKICIHTGIL